MNDTKLFLKANSIEDCDVISSLLQDSIFHISYLSFHDERKCLKLMVNRFCWELIVNKNHCSRYFRVHSGLYIYNVSNIIVNGSMKDMKNKHLNLLSMHAHEDEINMLFSEVGNMCIKVKGIFLYLKDLHEKYASPSLPDSHWSEEIKSNSSVINYK